MDEAILQYVKENTIFLWRADGGIDQDQHRQCLSRGKSSTIEVKAGPGDRNPKNPGAEQRKVREALAESINTIIDTVRITWRNPPELAADIVDKGIVLVGETLLKTWTSPAEVTASHHHCR